MHLTVISATLGIVIALACAWACRRLAASGGRNVALWTLLGLLFTVVALAVLVVLPLVAGDPEGGLASAAGDGEDDVSCRGTRSSVRP